MNISAFFIVSGKFGGKSEYRTHPRIGKQVLLKPLVWTPYFKHFWTVNLFRQIIFLLPAELLPVKGKICEL